MTLTLNGGIDAQARELRVTGTVGAEITSGYLFRLDSEVLELARFAERHFVTGDALGGPDLAHWRVRRGALGTVMASHSGGVAVLGLSGAVVAGTDETPPTDPVAGGGGVQQVSLLGPYVVNYNDANINSDIVLVGVDLPDGAIVTEMWANHSIAWKTDNNADADFKLEVASYPDPYYNIVIKEYANTGGIAHTIAEAGRAYGESVGHTHDVPAGTDAAGGVTTQFTHASSAPPRIVLIDYAKWTVEAGGTVTSIKLAVEVYANGGDHFTQGRAEVYALIATPA